MSIEGWVVACQVDEVEEEDVIRFDYDDQSFAIYRTSGETFYATDGYCSHERVHLAEGLVMDHIIECPKHNGRFDFTTGEPKRAPVCKAIRTYPVMVEGGQVYIKIG